MTDKLDVEHKYSLYKILIVGDIRTGKTSIIKRYVHNVFSQYYKSTIGVNFALKSINLNDNTIVRLQLWDIAGQERFGNMKNLYYREAVGAFIVFDVSRTNTFEAVVKWKNDIDSKVLLPNGEKLPIILLANKCDLVKADFIQEEKQLNKFCQDNGFIGWFETSAKNDIGIGTATASLVEHIMINTQNEYKPKQFEKLEYIQHPLSTEYSSCC